MFAFVSNWSAWRRYAMYYESSVWQNKTFCIWEVTVHSWCTFEYLIDRHLEILGPRVSSHPRCVSDMQLKVLEPGLVLMLVNWYSQKILWYGGQVWCVLPWLTLVCVPVWWRRAWLMTFLILPFSVFWLFQVNVLRDNYLTLPNASS